MQFKAQCGNHPSVTQPGASFTPAQYRTMMNGSLQQHNVSAPFYLNQGQSYHGIYANNAGGNGSGTSIRGEDTASASNAGVQTNTSSKKNSNLNQNGNIGQGNLSHKGMQLVQPPSLVNTQTFPGTSPVLRNSTNQQSDDTQDGSNRGQLQPMHSQFAQNFQGTPLLQSQQQEEGTTNAMPNNILGIDGQLSQIQTNHSQQINHFSQSTIPHGSSSASSDVKRQMLIHQRYAIQQLELKLKAKNKSEINTQSSNATCDSSSRTNSPFNSQPGFPPFSQNMGQNTSTNQLMGMQPNVVQGSTCQMNIKNLNAVSDLSQQTKQGVPPQVANDESSQPTNEGFPFFPQPFPLDYRPDSFPKETAEAPSSNTQNSKDDATETNSTQEGCESTTEATFIDPIPLNHNNEKIKTIENRRETSAWRSKDDIPERERVFKYIFNAIQGTRPHGNNITQKLPLMAKRLEERLYQFAKSKEDYTNTRTLKKRLQRLIFGMGSNIGKMKTNFDFNLSNLLKQDDVASKDDNKIQKLKLIHQNITLKQKTNVNSLRETGDTKSPKCFTEDEIRNVQKQQHRLLLLRHASKCSQGDSCTTPFCSQMKRLWKHMRNCCNVECETPHCFSSRCVLNHYRICSKHNRTASCVVCAPLLKHKDKNSNNIAKDQKLCKKEKRIIEQTSGQKSQEDFERVRVPGNVSDITLSETQKSTVTHLPVNDSKSKKNKEPRIFQQKHLQQRLVLQGVQQQQMQLIKKQENLKEKCKRVTPQSQEWQNLQNQLYLTSQYQFVLQKQMLQLQEQCKKLEKEKDVVISDMDEQNFNAMTTPRNVNHKKRRESEISSENIESKESTNSQDKGKALKIMKSDGQRCSSNDKNNKDGLIVRQEGKGNVSPGLTELESNKICDNISLSQVAATPPLSSESSKFSDSRVQGNLASNCLPLVINLLNDPCGWVFKDPVDPEALGLPDYFDVIKRPMDLSLIKKRLEDGFYNNLDKFKADVLLVFQNAILYNGEDSEVGKISADCMSKFEEEFEAVFQKGIALN